jgi:hypothetical protein
MSLRELSAKALRRARWPLVYAAVCAAILLGVQERAWQHVSTLNDEEWQPIQDFIRPNRQGEEPICFLPSWTRGHAVDQYKFRNIDVLASPEEAWTGGDEPEPGFWVVSQFGAFDPDDVPEDLYPHRAHRVLGQAEIFLFRREPFGELPDSLIFHLREASCVYHGPGSRRVPLVWRRTGYYLPRNHPEVAHHDYVGCRVTHDRFAGRARYGIWMHPPVAGRSVSLTFPEVEVRPWLEVSGGLRDAVATSRGEPVKVQVILDGRTLETLSFPPTRGWKTFGVRVGRREGTARLSLKVSTTRNHSRHFILDARMTDTQPRDPRRPRAPARRPAPAPAPEPADDAGSDGDGAERDEGTAEESGAPDA